MLNSKKKLCILLVVEFKDFFYDKTKNIKITIYTKKTIYCICEKQSIHNFEGLLTTYIFSDLFYMS